MCQSRLVEFFLLCLLINFLAGKALKIIMEDIFCSCLSIFYLKVIESVFSLLNLLWCSPANPMNSDCVSSLLKLNVLKLLTFPKCSSRKVHLVFDSQPATEATNFFYTISVLLPSKSPFGYNYIKWEV